jgi:hypothetical protein
MRFQTVKDHFTKDSTIPKEWLENFEVTLIPSFNAKDYGSAIDSQVKRIKVLQTVLPELKSVDFKNNLVILGKGALEQLLLQLNSAYKPIILGTEKLTAQEYANYIKLQLLPISNQGYTYFHDVYFHAAGSHNIPDVFTRWWKSNHMRLNETESVMMASVVEWTTLKGVSPIMEDMFSPERWNQLELFFMGQDRNICNAKNLNLVYKKFMPLMNKIILEWHGYKT